MNDPELRIVETHCPVPGCGFASVYECGEEDDLDEVRRFGAHEVRDHLNANHYPDEVKGEDISELIKE